MRWRKLEKQSLALKSRRAMLYGTIRKIKLEIEELEDEERELDGILANKQYGIKPELNYKLL